MGRTRMFAVAAALVTLLAGCGDDSPDADPATQPAPDVTTFQQGDFSGIPLPPLADAAGERTERDGVVVQSFVVRNRTPADVLEFYADYFDQEGVPVIADPEQFGNDAWRGSWLLDDRELLVSATPAPTIDEEDADHADVTTQMSLELSPAGGGGHANDPAGSPPQEQE